MSGDLIARAVETQAALHEWFSTDTGMSYAAAAFETLDDHVTLPDDAGISRGDFLDTLGVSAHLALTEPETPTYAVTDDICVVLDAAWPSIPMYPLHDSDLPSTSGFVWFDRPFIASDSTPERKPLAIRAFGWHGTVDDEGTHGVMLLLWTDLSDPRDHLHAEYEAADAAGRRVIEPPLCLWSMVGGVWALDRTPPDDDVFRLLLTFLRFIAEPWVSNEPAREPRAFRRRAAREGRPEPKVRIVELRRRQQTATKGHESASTPVQWSHRWVVGAATGGFWRNQWYPLSGVHRPKWIFPYEKGPADAPLLVRRPRKTKTVYRVDR